jgi:hypothetical protein
VTERWHQVQADLREPVRELRAKIPDTWRAYAQLHHHALAAGALSEKTKRWSPRSAIPLFEVL